MNGAEESSTSWPAVVVAAVGLVSLLIALATLYRLRKRAHEDRTYEYFRRYVDWDFAQHISAAVLAARWGDLKALTQRERDEIMLVVNFFDELAAHFIRGRLDQALTADQFGFISRHYYGKFEWFVEAFREKDPRAFNEWREMNRRLESRRNNADTALGLVRETLWHNPQPTQ